MRDFATWANDLADHVRNKKAGVRKPVEITVEFRPLHSRAQAKLNGKPMTVIDDPVINLELSEHTDFPEFVRKYLAGAKYPTLVEYERMATLEFAERVRKKALWSMLYGDNMTSLEKVFAESLANEYTVHQVAAQRKRTQADLSRYLACNGSQTYSAQLVSDEEMKSQDAVYVAANLRRDDEGGDLQAVVDGAEGSLVCGDEGPAEGEVPLPGVPNTGRA